MRAVVYERFGGPEVLELREWPRPEPKSGEVVVAVHAAGVNPVDAQNRTDGAWAALEPPVIPGYDFSDVVERIGARAVGWAAGDEVFGALPVRVTRSGSYAEYVAVPAGTIAPKPERLSHVEAAAAPVAACTAHEALRRLRLEPASLVDPGGRDMVSVVNAPDEEAMVAYALAVVRLGNLRTTTFARLDHRRDRRDLESTTDFAARAEQDGAAIGAAFCAARAKSETTTSPKRTSRSLSAALRRLSRALASAPRS